VSLCIIIICCCLIYFIPTTVSICCVLVNVSQIYFISSLLHFTLAFDLCNFMIIMYKCIVGANCPTLCIFHLQNYLRHFDKTGVGSIVWFICRTNVPFPTVSVAHQAIHGCKWSCFQTAMVHYDAQPMLLEEEPRNVYALNYYISLCQKLLTL
jgi:hypothetical protein